MPTHVRPPAHGALAPAVAARLLRRRVRLEDGIAARHPLLLDLGGLGHQPQLHARTGTYHHELLQLSDVEKQRRTSVCSVRIVSIRSRCFSSLIRHAITDPSTPEINTPDHTHDRGCRVGPSKSKTDERRR